jgi:hypothetical protein
MKQININGTDYTLRWTTGSVINSGKMATTEIKGSGGGTNFNNGGYQNPITITSTTTIHNEIFLMDKEGKEHSYNLTDFNVSCNQGNILTIIWGNQEHLLSTPILVLNHSTSQKFYNQKDLVQIFEPLKQIAKKDGLIYLIISCIVGFISHSFLAALICLTIGALLLQWRAKIIGKNRANKFLSSIKFEDYKN